jgi:hypothetical protein
MDAWVQDRNQPVVPPTDRSCVPESLLFFSSLLLSYFPSFIFFFLISYFLSLSPSSFPPLLSASRLLSHSLFRSPRR